MCVFFGRMRGSFFDGSASFPMLFGKDVIRTYSSISFFVCVFYLLRRLRF